MLCRILLTLIALTRLAHMGHSQDWELQYTDAQGHDRSETGDSLALAQKLRKIIPEAIAEGYATAHLDSVSTGQNTLLAHIYYGQRYTDMEVSMDSSVLAIVNSSRTGQRAWRSLSIDQKDISAAMKDVLNYLENNGYPFAQLQLSDIDASKSTISASLHIDRGPLIRIDTLIANGYEELSDGFLGRYLDLRQEAPYSHKRVLAIKQKLNNLPYLSLAGEPVVTFVNERAEITLPLQPKKASRFDFILGLVPNEDGQSDSRYTLTGDFLAEMVNRLGRGESLFAQIRRLRPEVQEVRLRANYPYILGQPLGLDGSFKLFRNATQFLEVEGRAGLQFILSGVDNVSLQLSSKSSRLLNVDTVAIKASGRLPTELDVSYTGGGVGWAMQHLDYRFNPSRGWQVSGQLDLGIRRIIKNQSIIGLSERAGVDFDQAYDTLALRTFQVEGAVSGEYFVPFNSWSTLKIGAVVGYKYNQERLYDNELFRIGGNRSLRGFAEEGIRADRYGIATLEYRILLDRNSFLALPLIDYSRYHTVLEGERIWDDALGIGMGLNFATAAGVFNISFVAGRRLDQSFNLQETKIHFGYVNLF